MVFLDWRLTTTTATITSPETVVGMPLGCPCRRVAIMVPEFAVQVAPSVGTDKSGLPEGNQWRYSEFISAVQGNKVERVRFAKDGTALQLTAVDGAHTLNDDASMSLCVLNRQQGISPHCVLNVSRQRTLLIRPSPRPLPYHSQSCSGAGVCCRGVSDE